MINPVPPINRARWQQSMVATSDRADDIGVTAQIRCQQGMQHCTTSTESTTDMYFGTFGPLPDRSLAETL